MAPKRGRVDEIPAAKRSRSKLNSIPDPHERLDVFMFGTGTICELGLGPRVTEVKRPRLNPLLPAKDIGIISIACGGAHSVAIDHDGKLWSWGQNDTGALGRETKEDLDEMNDDNDINPVESSPGKIDVDIDERERFVAVGATDSASAAITSRGFLYAWGTFIDDGNKAFSHSTKFQTRPLRIKGLTKAVSVVGGKDHFLILNEDGHVYAWGVGSSYQLGVRVRNSLRSQSKSRTIPPVRISTLRNIVHIAAGDYSSYAIDSAGRVFSWGLNNFGQCGIPDPVGPNVFIERPTHARFWDDKNIVQIAAGGHHSLWLSSNGSIYTAGETNFHQLGIPYSDLPKNTVREQDGTPSFVPTACKLTKGAFEDEPATLPPMKYVAVGTDHCLALSKLDGSIWTWGFGAVYQLGHGKPAGEDGPEDEELPRRIKNTATTGRNMVWAGAGGQFSVVASPNPESD